MNKYCFRLIFSKSLGFLIPVAEICSAQRKPGQPPRLLANASPKLSPATSGKLKALPLALLGLLPNAFAEIVVEPGQQTTMTQSANGVPVVEIADPNSKGLSHNRFEQFNVSQPGVIFNNSLRDGTSQIGINNYVTHNPNLTREAKAILAEVTGNSPSTLAGTLEVFGGKADILIAEGYIDWTNANATSFTNGMISGTNVSLKAKSDHSMEGATVNADRLSYNIGGNQSITSKQDTSKMDHTRTNFSATGGAAISTMGLVPTASAQVSGGADHDNSSLTKGQSGITAGAMNLHVGGDQTLTGAHIISKSADGSYRVDGKSTAAALHDSRDKDGGYGGGGGGLSKSGLISVVVEAGRVDQVKYKADQNSTVDLAGMDMSVGKGVVGELNRDASKLSDVQEDRKIAGTDIRFELAIPSWKKKKKTDDNNPPPPPPPEVDGESRRPPVIDPDTPRPPVIDVVDGGGADNNARHMSEQTTGTDLRRALTKINSHTKADQADIQKNPVTVQVRGADGTVEPVKISNKSDIEQLNGKILVTGQQAEGLPVPKYSGKSSTLYIQVVKQYGGGYTYTLTPKKPTKIIDNSW